MSLNVIPLLHAFLTAIFFALVLLFLDLFLLLHICLICANYLLIYLLSGGRSIQSLHAQNFEPLHMVWGRASTGSKASGLGTKPHEAG